jgi:hypothetical protein
VPAGTIHTIAGGQNLDLQQDGLGANGITTVAGTGVLRTVIRTGVEGTTGDGGPATFARIAIPNEHFINETGTIYFTEGDNHHIRGVDPGDPSVKIPAIPALRSDFNEDTRVDFRDFLVFASAFGRNPSETGYAVAVDLDANGSIDFTDFLVFVEAFQTEASS